MPNPIVLSRFGGCFPELAPHNLPDGAASDALNCDLRWGKITALPSTLPDATTVGGEVAPGDLFLLRKAKMPVWADWSPLVANFGTTRVLVGTETVPGWITLEAGVWLQAVKLTVDPAFDFDTLQIDLFDVDGTPLKLYYDVYWEPPNIIRIGYEICKIGHRGTPVSYRFGASGGPTADMTIALGSGNFRVPDVYSVLGPSFYVGFAKGEKGYPATVASLGNTGPASPGILGGVVSIVRDTKTVAYVSCADVQITSLADSESPIAGADYHLDFIPASKGEIVLKVEFPYDKERSLYYAATALYQNPDDIEDVTEGPLGYRQWVSDSELGDPVEIVVPEGQRPQMTLALQTTPASSKTVTHIRVYRATQAARGWKRVQDVTEANWSSWTDDVLAPQGDEVPTYGNAPTVNPFRSTTIIMPGQFALGWTNTPTPRVYPSEVFAFHIYPEEYYLEFNADDPIQKMIGVGSGAVLFTTSKVYWIYGSDPAQMAYVLLSDTKPLLDADTICRDGDSVYYIYGDSPTPPASHVYDAGVAKVTGGQLTSISEPFLSRATFYAKIATWVATALVVRASEGMVWFGNATQGYVLEPNHTVEGYALVPYNLTGSTHPISGFTYANTVLWQSKEWQFDEPINLATLHYLGSTSAKVTVIGDDASTVNSVADKSVTSLTGLNTSQGVRRLSVLVHNPSSGAALGAERLSLAPRVAIPVKDDPIRVTPADVAPDGTCWLQFVNAGRFRGGVLYAKKGGGVVTLTPRA